MGVTNTNSAQIANAIAKPKVLNAPFTERGTPEQYVAQLSAASGDSSNSTYRFMRVRSGDLVSSLKLSTTPGTSTASVADIGLYDADGGAVVDQTFFATGLDLHTAAVTGWTEQLMKAGATLTPAKSEKRIWEALALASDPDKVYDVTITMTTAVATAALIIAMKLELVR